MAQELLRLGQHVFRNVKVEHVSAQLQVVLEEEVVDATAGLHEDVPLGDAALQDGDVYHLLIEAVTVHGATVVLAPVHDLRVDTTPPTLLDALAVQSQHGSWRAALDRVEAVLREASAP